MKCLSVCLLLMLPVAGAADAAVSVRLSASTSTPSVLLPVTWTAQATGADGPLQYQFWRFDAPDGWRVVQDYSSSFTYTWTPAPADVGQHALQVWVRRPFVSLPYEAWASTGLFQVTLPATLQLHPAGLSQIEPGTLVAWRASVNAVVPLEYQFWRPLRGLP